MVADLGRELYLFDLLNGLGIARTTLSDHPLTLKKRPTDYISYIQACTPTIPHRYTLPTQLI